MKQFLAKYYQPYIYDQISLGVVQFRRIGMMCFPLSLPHWSVTGCVHLFQASDLRLKLYGLHRAFSAAYMMNRHPYYQLGLAAT